MGWSGVRREVGGLLDLVFPPLCLLCHQPLHAAFEHALCGVCRAGCLPIVSPRCPRCSLPFATIGGSDHPCAECLRAPPAFDWTVAGGLYEEALRHAIHRFKFDGQLALDRPLARLLAAAWTDAAPGWSPDLLIPVPLHPDRLRQRTYNQALLIARELGRLRQLPVEARLLERVISTRPQAGLTAAQRHANLVDAFATQRALSGARVLLVDDVMTTGTTARLCAATLKAGGAAQVGIAVLARARRHSPVGLAVTVQPLAGIFSEGS